MTVDEALRARLSAIDPVRRGGAVGPLPTPETAEIQERVMQIMDHTEAKGERPARPRWRRPLVAAAAAVTLVVVAVGTVLAAQDGARTPRPSARGTLTLSVPSGGSVSSCVPFGVAVLAEMPVAFAGTVAAVSEDSVTLDVDRWYRGGSADRVTVDLAPGRTSVALDGVKFVDGQRYLLTATNGTVNGCGFSGRATPDLERAYDEAFPR